MDTIITDSLKTQYGTYVTLSAGKRTAEITFPATGGIRVCVKNAAHRVWRGFGREFETIDEALNSYKSPEVKAMIFAASGFIENA